MKGSVLSARAPWRREQVYVRGDDFFEALLEGIGRARRSVELETYIFDRDRLGESVLDGLRRAAGRGARVRLLLDGVGCSQWSYPELEALRREGVETRIYHPLPWQRKHYSWIRSLRLRRILVGIGKLNRRNHRKSCVIDGETAFVGGMNVSARHLERESGNKAWRDCSAQVQGPGVQALSAAFERTWSPSSRRFLPFGDGGWRPGGVRGNDTHRRRKRSYRELLMKIAGAQRRVWLTTPYFIPDLSLVRALRFSAWAGTDVRLLLPMRADVWGIRWAAKAFYQVLLTAGVRVFEYAPSLLHAKTCLIDDWATVGSSNLNHRSLLHDLEIDLILRQAKSLSSLSEAFKNDLKVSKEIDLRSWKGRNPFSRLIEGLALVFRKWI